VEPGEERGRNKHLRGEGTRHHQWRDLRTASIRPRGGTDE
jgi:hypothetical protein